MLERKTDVDGPLIERIACGDQLALADLFVRYRLPLFHYLLQFTSDYGRAEEILQDTFIAVWKNAQSFEGNSLVKAWLFGIARRRAAKTLSRHELLLTELTELESVSARDVEPEAFLLAQDAHAELMHAIGRLPVLYQEVLLLIFVHEFAYQEVADVLDVPLGTVKSRLNHARRALKLLLRGEEEVKNEKNDSVRPCY